MANLSSLLTRTRSVALALAVSGALAACGGGGGGNRVPGPIPGAVGNTLAITTNGRLVAFDRTNGGISNSVQITGLMPGDTLVSFDIRPATNQLVAIATPSQRLYSIDSGTGAATVLSTVTGATLVGTVGIDFNPVPDALRIVTSSGQNLRVPNIATGAATVDTPLTLNGSPALSVVGAAYSNSIRNACRTQLFYLDTANARLLTTAAPNGGVLSVVGSLNVAITGGVTNNGIEIFTDASGNNTASVVVTSGGRPIVYSLNTTTGLLTGAAAINGLQNGENFIGIAAPSTPTNATQAAGELTGLSAANQIFTFNSSAPNKVCTGPTSISGLNAGENVVGIDVRPADSNLYGVGVSGTTGRVFQINRTSGAISAAQTINTPVMGTNFGVDFNPVPDRLRLTSDSGQNLRVNVADGTTIVDGATGGNITAAAYTNSFGPTSPSTTTLYTINSTTGMLNIQNPPNNGTQVAVGALGIMGGITGVNGFDINGQNNQAFAGLQVAGATATTLYGINLASGAATAFAGGNIGVGTPGGTPPITGAIRGLTLTANPQVTVVGVTATGNQLVNFSATTNLGVAANLATVTTTQITGLQGGENVVGADLRSSAVPPLNNALYIVTDQARTYVVNPATGAATQQITLMANAGDPFAGFMGLTSFGIDFNPAADRLRTVSGTRNLRSVLDGVAGMTAGTTFTDTALTRAAATPALSAPAILAAAYSNSIPGAPAPAATTLFTLDSVNDMLFVQNPPNNGVQVPVGPLGINATSFGGFDIIGPSTALAIINTATVTNGLYSINLANGAATLIGSVNTGVGTPAIAGIALPVSAVNPGAGGATVTAVVNVAGVSALAQFASTATGVGTVAMIGNITGLAMGETIVDIDFRPSTATEPAVPAAGMPVTPNGTLYGFSSLGILYTINLSTLAAVPIALADAVGMTGGSGMPFTAVAGTLFGIDFNPVPDRLRVVSNTGQNLRINVGSGATLLDGTIALTSPIAVNAVAAAYTNSFVPPAPVPPNMAVAPTTVLFDIDLATNTLQRQDPNPNGGVLTQVGRLDAINTFGPNIGFDIVGGENGLVLAVMQRTGATQSSLYRIDLTTGQATLIGDIGPAMNPTLVGGLALRLR